MGDVAGMILDGTLCEGCGAYIGAAVDCPRKCRQCEKDFKPVAKKETSRQVSHVPQVR